MTSITIDADDHKQTFSAENEGASASIKPKITMSRSGGAYYLFINPVTGRPTNLTVILVGVLLLCVVYVSHYRGKSEEQVNPKMTKLDYVQNDGNSKDDRNPDLIPFPHLVHPVPQRPGGSAGQGDVVVPGAFIGGVPQGNRLVPLARQNIPRAKPKEFPVTILQNPSIANTEKWKCPTSTYVLIVVASLPSETTLRTSIRRTWGSPDNFKELKISGLTWRVLFAIGSGSDEEDVKIANENDKYGDVIQGKFDDTGVEDTRKAMMSFKWISEVLSAQYNCRPSFVLKTPGNVYIHLPFVLDWIAHKVVNLQDVYRGKILRQDLPIRTKEDPLYIPPEDFAGDTFPDIIRNPVYFFSTDVIEKMVQRFDKISPIAMEDSYLGLLANDIGVKPVDDDNFLLMKRPRNVCHYKKMMFLFDVSPAEQVHVFNVVERGHMSESCIGGL